MGWDCVKGQTEKMEDEQGKWWVQPGQYMNNKKFTCPLPDDDTFVKSHLLPSQARRICIPSDAQKDAEIKMAYRDFKAKLKDLADSIDERNANEPERRFNGFNPRYFEWSVSL